MHRMHRIFSGDGWLVFPDILKSARDHRPSQRLVQQPPVLIILCIDVPFIVLLDGSARSRGAGARLADKREFPKPIFNMASDYTLIINRLQSQKPASGTTNALKPEIEGPQTIILRTPPGEGSMPRAS